MLLTTNIELAAAAIKRGEIIAYPTEAVYGLGCCPFNEKAVKRLLAIKQRPIAKGLILVASDWTQVENLTTPISGSALEKVFSTWPGPYTWVFPASEQAPRWITGQFSSIAVRISAHPLVQSLCQAVGPLVSTSANISTQSAAKSAKAVNAIFGDKLELILVGNVGNLIRPTEIRDVLNQEIIRS